MVRDSQALDDYKDILLEAKEIYKERNAVRGNIWRDFSARTHLMHLRSKLARIEYAMGQDPTQADLANAIIDDSLDLINYAAFLVVQVREGKL